MRRDGLFFDPLQDDLQEEADEPRQQAPAPVRHSAPDPERLQAQRRRELERVQAELRRMARGRGPR